VRGDPRCGERGSVDGSAGQESCEFARAADFQHSLDRQWHAHIGEPDRQCEDGEEAGEEEGKEEGKEEGASGRGEGPSLGQARFALGVTRADEAANDDRRDKARLVDGLSAVKPAEFGRHLYS
jgi:hypothetical protein